MRETCVSVGRGRMGSELKSGLRVLQGVVGMGSEQTSSEVVRVGG